MGCDIHYMLQKKVGEQWGRLDYHLRGVDRHYQLFGFLAGVRDHNVYSLGDANGLPEGYTLKRECEFTSELRIDFEGS